MNDKIFKTILFVAALCMPIVCGGVVYALITDAYDAFEHFGFLGFLTSSEWSYTEGNEHYGALPFITGTLMTTLLALVFCIPFSLPVALFVGEYFKGRKKPSGKKQVDAVEYLLLRRTDSSSVACYFRRSVISWL